MTVYADTNYVTRLYLERPEAGRAQVLFETERPLLPVPWLLRLEVVNALQQAIYSGFGESVAQISAGHAAACQQQFREDLRDGTVMRLTHISLHEVSRHFEEIALRHTAKHGFRAYDILHVASALTLKCSTFWSFDKRASKLAKLEGLRIL